MSSRKRNKSRAGKARKPRLFDYDGHQLTSDQCARYKAAVDIRMKQGYTGERALDAALADVLAQYRPTRRAEAQLKQVYQRVMNAMQWIGTAQQAPWFVHGQLRQAGVDMLTTIIGELHICAGDVIAIREAIANEDREKLQDWQQRTLPIERDGQEVAS